VGVAVKTALGVSVLAALLTCEVPDDQSLVARSREEHVGAGILSVPAHLILYFVLMRSTYFSMLVAREVTQPVWPWSSPRMINCSAILKRLCGREGKRSDVQ
jgi:hypothetical protein